ncbi:MAG: GNAT family N-acetyltransferase [Mycobacteriales bacterium]
MHISDRISRLERVAALGWPAPETQVMGGWLLRAAEGWTGRANSVLPLGEPGRPLDEALVAVRRWYAERGLPARFQVPLPLRADLDGELHQRGWPAYNPTLVRVARIDEVLVRGSSVTLPEATLAGVPSPQWLAAYHYRGAASLPPIAVRVMTAAADPVFASIVIDGVVAGVGRAVVDRDSDGVGWCGITALETVPAWRRRGVGAHLVRALLTWAAGRGATEVYLQVMRDNVAAHAMYDRLGFAVSHSYHYRQSA